MARLIPDRWEEYKPLGQRIEGTRFICFKVPLSPGANRLLRDKKKQLTLSSLLKDVPNLGLVIDLTNTCRYYDGSFFDESDIEYQKIATPGREVPEKQYWEQFKNTVKNYLAKNADNDKLIGVHCTHGLNRTGYFVCMYMAAEMGIEPEVAVQLFNKARGHDMERQNYIDAMIKYVRQGKDGKKEPEYRSNRANQRVERHAKREAEECKDWRDVKQEDQRENEYSNRNGANYRGSFIENSSKDSQYQSNYNRFQSNYNRNARYNPYGFSSNADPNDNLPSNSRSNYCRDRCSSNNWRRNNSNDRSSSNNWRGNNSNDRSSSNNWRGSYSNDRAASNNWNRGYRNDLSSTNWRNDRTTANQTDRNVRSSQFNWQRNTNGSNYSHDGSLNNTATRNINSINNSNEDVAENPDFVAPSIHGYNSISNAFEKWKKQNNFESL